MLNATSSICRCEIGFKGPKCGEFQPVETSAFFDGESWVQFSKELMPHQSTEDVETLEFKFRTKQEDGMILWQGQPPGTFSNDVDYMAIGLSEGYLEFV